MSLKIIGNSNLKICPVGQGTLFGRSSRKIDDETISNKIKVLEYGLDLGMNFIDTGEDYEKGLSEKLLNKVIKNKRQKAIIGSKFKPSNNSYKGVLNSIEGTLKRIGTDYIDLYQIQWPNPNIELEETFKAFEKLVEQGKILYYGVGNFDLLKIKEAIRIDKLKKFISIQTEYDLFNRHLENDLKFLEQNNLSVIAYMSLGKETFNTEEKKLLSSLSEKYKKSVRSIVLNWIISHKNVSILTSSTSLEHTKENFLSSSFELDKKDINDIDLLFRRNVEKIDPKDIEVLDYDESDNAHLIYTNLEDALNNRHGIKPNAEEIALEIKTTGKLLRPIELKLNDNKDSNKPYVLVRGRMRFWGWIVAYGYDKKIEAKIFK